ncbi:MAG: glycosyltransferase family 2 protein, partial [Rickettsiales bacterium]
MIKVSVVIPYFQRQAGILRRAVESILSQEVPPNNNVEIIVVDDGSPVSAQSEIEGLVFYSPFNLNIIKQPNGGVAMARNTALKAVDDSTKYIAFLDSDDTWHKEHLRKGLEVLEQGADFYFCDNRRYGHHDSHFATHQLVKSYITKYSKNSGIVDITSDKLSTTILREFSVQTSTVIYRRSIYPELLFDTSFIQAGEDIIFFLQLAAKAKNICFSPEIMVDCGTG